MSRNLSALSGRKGLEDNLFEQLGKASEPSGAPDPEALRQLAEVFLMGPANLYGAASFYDLTRQENRGKEIHICNGAACMVSGTQIPLRKELEDVFRPDKIGELACLGRCHENGAFLYRNRTFSGLPAGAAKRVLQEDFSDPGGHFAIGHYGSPLLTAPALRLSDYREMLDGMFRRPPEEILREIQQSGLRGRGGAGFPLGIKLEACRKVPGTHKFIVCNADEGDPGSYSDRYLLEQRPLAVLMGMLIAGYAAGAETGVIYLRAEYPEAAGILGDAINAIADAGLSGNNLLGSGFAYRFKLIRGQGAYVCGEETALLASIEGQRPEVRVRPPFPVESGLFGFPTLVSNVETLANLPFIQHHGDAAFAKIGTAKSSGTKLLSISSWFNRPGVYEVPMGTPLRVVTEDLAGGYRTPVKALHVGGPLGGIVPMHKVADLRCDFESFAENGFLFGHASIVAIPESLPMIEYLEHLLAFAAHESCGKCFPCRIGTVRGKELVQKAQTEGCPIDPILFADLLDTLEKGSLCALGGGIPLPVRNLLTYFGEELRPYFS